MLAVPGRLSSALVRAERGAEPVPVAVDEAITSTARRLRDRAGRACHWILEIHLIDRERGFGGFHEELLDLG